MLKRIQGYNFYNYVTIVTLKLSGECIYLSSGNNFHSHVCAVIDLKCHSLKLYLSTRIHLPFKAHFLLIKNFSSLLS